MLAWIVIGIFTYYLVSFARLFIDDPPLESDCKYINWITAVLLGIPFAIVFTIRLPYAYMTKGILSVY